MQKQEINDTPGHPNLVDINSAARPFFWIKWTNVFIIAAAVNAPFAFLSMLLNGELDVETLALFALLALVLGFAAWIAWKNITVLNAVTQPWTLTSLCILFCFSIALAVAFTIAVTEVNDETEVKPILSAAFFFGLLGFLSLVSIFSVIWLRRVRLTDLRVKLIDMLRALARLAPVSKKLSLPPKNPRLAWACIAAGGVVLLGVHLIPDSIYYASGNSARSISQIGSFAFILFLYARSQFQPTATSLLSIDTRRPILFLRSFRDEEQKYYSNCDSAFVDHSLESRIATHFYAYGPFIAVGAPKSKQIALGAARAALTDSEWQGKVTEWIDSSSCIVLLAGITNWIDWELRKIIERGQTLKLILSFPQIRAHWFAKDKRFRTKKRTATCRLEAIRSAFAGTEWERQLAYPINPLHLRSIVFGEHGQITMITAKSRNRNSYHLAVLIAHFMLLPGAAEV